MQKALIILAVVLSLASAGVGIVNRNNSLKSKADLVEAVAAKEAATKAQLTAIAQLNAANEKLSLVDADRQKNAAEITDLRARAEKATSDLAGIQSELAQKDTLIAQQKNDLAAKDARLADLEKGGKSSGSRTTDDAKKEIDELKILVSSQQAKLKDTESQLSELRQREKQRRDKMMRAGLEGKILAVNSSWNFVVIDLGDRNGVINNSELLIKRGSQLIGKVRITSVEPSTSVADIVANSVRRGLSVQPGDSVIYTGPESESDKKP